MNELNQNTSTRYEAQEFRYILATPNLAATVVSSEGGRVSSLMDKETNVEFLMQSPYPRRLRIPSIDARFQGGAPGGIEECLPSVGACGAEGENGAVPDHGDFWQLPWDVEMSVDSELLQSSLGFSRPLRFSRELSLNGRCLQIRYRIANLADRPTAFLYACHPLFAVDEGDTVLLLDEVTSLFLNYSRNDRVGWPGDSVPWLRRRSPDQNLSVL